MSRTYKLDKTERDILNCITRSPNVTPKEIAREVGTDENTAKRLYNRLFAENACSQLVLPNYALLGYKVMIVQKLSIKSRSLPDAPFIMTKIESEWKNCIDCHETYDGKIIARSVWRNAEEFKNARTRFHQKHGMDWLGGEDVDMVPLNDQKGVITVRGFWDDENDGQREGMP